MVGKKGSQESSRSGQSSSQRSSGSRNTRDSKDSKVSQKSGAGSHERSDSEDERRQSSSVSGSSRSRSPNEESPQGSSASGSPRRSDSRDSRGSSHSRDSSHGGSQHPSDSSHESSDSRSPRDRTAKDDSPKSSDSQQEVSPISDSRSDSSDDHRGRSQQEVSPISDSRSDSSDDHGHSPDKGSSSPENSQTSSSSRSRARSSQSSGSKKSSSSGSRDRSRSPSESESSASDEDDDDPNPKGKGKGKGKGKPSREGKTSKPEPESKEPAPSPRASPGTTQVVSFSMKVNNVLHSALMSNPTLLANFTAGVKESIAAGSGNGISANHVEVRFLPGSVIVQASIAPPSSVLAESVVASLQSSESEFQNLVHKVKSMPGIKAISTGPIGLSDITKPTVSERTPPKKLENGQFEVIAETSDRQLGFTTNREQHRELFYTIDHGSWAEKVGIHVYDEMVMVNGLATQPLQARNLFAQLQQRPLRLVIMPMRVEHTTLKIVMIGCQGLRKLTRMGESRIFCTCDFNVTRGEPTEKQLQVATPSISGSRSPKWFHTCEVAYDNSTKSLRFNVWDQDNAAKDLLGRVNLPRNRFDPDSFEGELVLEEGGIGAVLKVKIEIVSHDARGSTIAGFSEDAASKANMQALTQMREQAQKELEAQLEKRVHDKEVELKAENRILELQIKELQAKLVAAELAKAKETSRENEHEQRMEFARKEVLLQQQHRKAMQEKEAEIRVFKAKLIEAEATALALKRSATAVLQQPANEALVKAQQRRAEQEIDELKIRLAQAELGLQSVKESMEHEVVPIEVQTSPRLFKESQIGIDADHEKEMLRIKLAQAEASLKAIPLAAKSASATAPPASTVRVECVSARGLKKREYTRELDPYCTCEVLPRKLGIHLRTKTMRGTHKPTWNHSEEFTFNDDITMLKFTVWDDGIGGASPLGVAVLARARFEQGGFSGELPLQEGGPEASLMIKVAHLKPANNDAPSSKKANSNQARPQKHSAEGKPVTKAEKVERRKRIQQTRDKIRESEMARIEEECHQQEHEKAALEEERQRPTPRNLQAQGQLQKQIDLDEEALRRQLRADSQLAKASYDSAQREEAAAKIQAATRGSLARSKVQNMREQRDEEWKEMQKKRERDAVNKRLRALEAKEARAREQAAATKIQAGYRGMATRRSVELMIEELGSRRYSQVHESRKSSPSPRYQTGAGSCSNQPRIQPHMLTDQRLAASSGRGPVTRVEAMRSAGYPMGGGGGHLPAPGGPPPPSVDPIMPISGVTASFSEQRVPIGRGSPAVGSGAIGPTPTRSMGQGPPTGGSMSASQRTGESVNQPAPRGNTPRGNTAGRPGPPDRIQRSEAIERASSEFRRGGGAGHPIFSAR